MSGLGLTNALAEYRQGVAWSDQQKQQAVENQNLQTVQQANKAAADAVAAAQAPQIAQQQQAWADAGNDPSTFQPQPVPLTPQVVLAGMHARSDALAQSGNLDLWTRNEAATAPVRNAIRQQVIGKALADYDATGDAATLAQTVYPTVHDGINIKSITTDPTGGLGMQAASQAANSGQTVTPTYDITLSNGQSHTLTGDQISTMAHDALMNPEDTAKYEFQSRLAAAKALSDAAAKKQEAAAKGEQDRLTEGVKGDNAMKVEGLRSNTSLQVGQGNNQATIQAAGIRGSAEQAAAGITANGRITAAGLRAGGGGADGQKKVQKTGVDSDGYVINYFKDGSAARALDNNGQPIRSGDYAKRVDSMVRTLSTQPGNISKSPSELRAMATQALSGAPVASPAPAPGLVSPPTPSSGVSGVSVSNW